MNEQIKQFLKHEDYRNILIGINLARIEGYSDIEIFDELELHNDTFRFVPGATYPVSVGNYHFNIWSLGQAVYEFIIHYHSNRETNDLENISLIDNDTELYQETFNKFKQLFIEHLMEGKYFNI